MGRKQINHEHFLAGFAAGTLTRIDAVLAPHEKRSAFIRTAVEGELKKRERRVAPKTGPAGADVA